MMHVGGICCGMMMHVRYAMMQVVDVVGEKVLNPQDEPSSFFCYQKINYMMNIGDICCM
mgnify:CR=1 FL=1